MINNKTKEFNRENQKAQEMLQQLVDAAQSQDLEQLVGTIIDLDDEIFNKISEQLKESVTKAFSSNSYKNNLAQKLSVMDLGSLEKEKEGYEQIQTFIDTELEDLSETKKAFLTHLFKCAYNGVLNYLEDPSKHIQVTIKKLSEDAIIPTYANKGDAGADIYAIDSYVIKPGETVLVHTGIALKIPLGFEAQVRPRSGMSLKTKIRVANAPGTIDSGYRGEVCVIMHNVDNSLSANSYIIHKGDKIAQLVFNEVPKADFIEGEVEQEESNTRGSGGFGSTDKK